MEYRVENNTLVEAELILEKEIKDIINNNFNICCPKCHSQNYSIYPTGCYLLNNKIVNEDIKWKCNNCQKIWASEFIKYENK